MTAEQTVNELKQMQYRKERSHAADMAYLLRVRRLLEELDPAEQFELGLLYSSVIKPQGAK